MKNPMIEIIPRPQYLADQSVPARDQFVFAYTITIRNLSEVPVQLLSRHWIIADGDGQTQEVRGKGVVGEQPVIGPGQEFTYTSGCALKNGLGTMRGSYQMRTEDGRLFDAPIPEFVLAEPSRLH